MYSFIVTCILFLEVKYFTFRQFSRGKKGKKEKV